MVASLPGRAGGRIAVRPVGLLRARSHPGVREVVVCVPVEDRTWGAIERTQDLPPQLRSEIEQLIERRPHARAKTEPVAWCSRDEALAAIDDAAARWAATADGHG